MTYKMRNIIFFLITVILFFSCKKEINLTSDGDFLSFSTDTLLFDTIFTTVGSATRYLKIYNNQNNDITINSISLGNKSQSSFRLNIDGEASHTVENILLRSNDSLYIFAEVTIDPNNVNNPLIETDSIIFVNNNQIQYVNLTAWGQDAYFHSGIPDEQQYFPQSNNLSSMLYCDFFNFQESECPEELINAEFTYYSINENTTWPNDKPHVIYGDLIIENQSTLTLQPGTEVYLHNNSWIVVSAESSLHSNGTINNPIWFQSDRSDNHSLTDYANTPGQWGKIWILPGSTNNQIEYTILKNGKRGIEVWGENEFDYLTENTMLTINNSIIYNMSNFGILAVGSKIVGKNLLIFNCGEHLLYLDNGGDYDFKHCTFANFWPFSRQTPSIVLNNYAEDSNGNYEYFDLVNASFGNCIIDGNVETELVFNKESDQSLFNYNLKNCILKSNEDYWNEWSNENSQEIILLNTDQNTGFIDYEMNDFQLDLNSIAIDAGLESIAEEVPYDINGNLRTYNPDIGCFEKQ